ncbi:MAG: hypothetical protein ACLQVK_25300 [Acidimicrobiales bacterium]
MAGRIAPSSGLAFIVSATLVYDAIAKACSSPQTTELNADKRAPTLIKWVNIGTAEGLALIAIAAFIDPQYRVPIVAGGLIAAGVTYAEYLHARKAGLASPEPPTENW